nr:hypothetical protein [Tanacetum cinerariifolium]
AWCRQWGRGRGLEVMVRVTMVVLVVATGGGEVVKAAAVGGGYGGGRRVGESGMGDRLDRKTGIIFGFARNARRKSFSAAGGSGRRQQVAGRR